MILLYDEDIMEIISGELDSPVEFFEAENSIRILNSVIKKEA